jgi:hypothetical protein
LLRERSTDYTDSTDGKRGVGKTHPEYISTSVLIIQEAVDDADGRGGTTDDTDITDGK